MNKYIYLFMLVTWVTSCKKDKISGNGPITSELRSLPDFTGVAASGATNIFITQDDNFEVELKAFSNLLPYLETRVSNKKLLVGYKKSSNISNDNSEAFIKMPELNSLSTNGSGNISVTGNFASGDFDASTLGSGNISLPSGTADNLSVKVAGSGNVTGFNLIANNVDITIDGSGDVKIHATEKLSVTINGSGNVYYEGDPAGIVTKISGSGKLIKQ